MGCFSRVSYKNHTAYMWSNRPCDCYEGFELMMKKNTTLPKQECGKHLESGWATSNNLDCNCPIENYSMCDFLYILSTKNWINRCSPYWKSPPPSSDYTPEILEKIWRSKFLLYNNNLTFDCKNPRKNRVVGSY